METGCSEATTPVTQANPRVVILMKQKNRLERRPFIRWRRKYALVAAIYPLEKKVCPRRRWRRKSMVDGGREVPGRRRLGHYGGDDEESRIDENFGRGMCR
ncbi:hypothetical protein L1887_19983 [Cichorium endivia]|nr:hypothetical protein L1887_19983 [Cichorium endivia]